MQQPAAQQEHPPAADQDISTHDHNMPDPDAMSDTQAAAAEQALLLPEHLSTNGSTLLLAVLSEQQLDTEVQMQQKPRAGSAENTLRSLLWELKASGDVKLKRAAAGAVPGSSEACILVFLNDQAVWDGSENLPRNPKLAVRMLHSAVQQQ